jgi:Lar family restriction alleviation protein
MTQETKDMIREALRGSAEALDVYGARGPEYNACHEALALLAAEPVAPPAPAGELEVGGLLPCPFCGGTAERIDVDAEADVLNAGGSYITCTDCFASSKLLFGEKGRLLEEAWNRRAEVEARIKGEE